MEADYSPVKDIEAEYKDITEFYDGSVRDAALFALLFNAMTSNKDFKIIKKLEKNYAKNYNHNKNYIKTLEEMMK